MAGGGWGRERERRRRGAERIERERQRWLAAEAREEGQRQRQSEREQARADKERRAQYALARHEEADELAAESVARIVELDGILVDGIGRLPVIAHETRQVHMPTAFTSDARIAGPEPTPAWSDYAPPTPGRFAAMWRGREHGLRLEQEARLRFEQETSAHRLRQEHRRRRLDTDKARHRRAQDEKASAVAAHNRGVDERRRAFQAGEQDAVERTLAAALSGRTLPSGIPTTAEVGYRPSSRQVLALRELPDTDVVPAVRTFRYVKTRDEIDTTDYKPTDLANRYAGVVAQLALLTLHDVFTATSAQIVDEVAVNCQLDTVDRATGQQERRCLLSVSATREEFDGLVLDQVQPVDCLRRLNALISPNPWDVEPVRPLFDPDLSRFRFVDAHEVAAHLDSRSVLVQQTPTEFEHLVRELFERMGMESWVTQASRDDGVDAVALNRDPVMGGLCVIQAKRYKNVVGADAVRALWGVMEDRKAGTGILVTTSYFGKATHEFAQRNERVRLIEGPQLKHLISEHLGVDVLLGSKPAPESQRWRHQA